MHIIVTVFATMLALCHGTAKFSTKQPPQSSAYSAYLNSGSNKFHSAHNSNSSTTMSTGSTSSSLQSDHNSSGDSLAWKGGQMGSGNYQSGVTDKVVAVLVPKRVKSEEGDGSGGHFNAVVRARHDRGGEMSHTLPLTEPFDWEVLQGVISDPDDQ